MINVNDIPSLIGAVVVDQNGIDVGTVGEVLVDAETSVSDWITVRTGSYGISQSFVPLMNATWDGKTVHLPFEKELVDSAPQTGDDSILTPEDEEEMLDHYSAAPSSPAVHPTRESDAGAYRNSTES